MSRRWPANAVTASFAPDDVKSRLLAEIEAYTAGFPA